MAILKHIASKNADYGEAQRYLMFRYDEDTMKPILDENGRLIPREEYYLDGINCDPFISLMLYLHPIIPDQAALMPVLEGIDLQRPKIYQAERDRLFFFIFPFAEIQSFRHFVQTLLSEIVFQNVRLQPEVLRQSDFDRSHFAGITPF